MLGIGRRLAGRVFSGGRPIRVATADTGRNSAVAAEAVEPVLPLLELLGGNGNAPALLLEDAIDELLQAGVVQVEVAPLLLQLFELLLEAVLFGVALNVPDQPRQVAVVEHFLQAAKLLRFAQLLG